jgi:hypothetical protein
MPRAITTICAFAALILSFVSSLAQEAKPAENSAPLGSIIGDILFFRLG